MANQNKPDKDHPHGAPPGQSGTHPHPDAPGQAPRPNQDLPDDQPEPNQDLPEAQKAAQQAQKAAREAQPGQGNIGGRPEREVPPEMRPGKELREKQERESSTHKR